MRIENKEERLFYEIESYKNYWSLTELKRQFDIEDYIKRKGKVKMNRNTVITRL